MTRLLGDATLLAAHRCMLPPPRRPRIDPIDVALVVGRAKLEEAVSVEAVWEGLTRAERAAVLGDDGALTRLVELRAGWVAGRAGDRSVVLYRGHGEDYCGGGRESWRNALRFSALRASECRGVGGDRCCKTVFQRIRGELVADRGLGQEGYRCHEGRNVVQVQVVAGIHHQAELTRALRGFADRGQQRRVVAGAERLGVAAGVDFYPVGAGVARSVGNFGSGSMNRITRQPSALAATIAGRANCICAASSFQPSSEVKASGASGTRVHCSGRVSRRIAAKRSSG